ncbi:hypothetical protein AAFP30_22200 [Gordonia sp. CPCC 205515]|uniref:WXG100-like domain-containing protein n=1 Tax=Gordonia sp. CPCC 205515 TaxID=3140791 RepID=UPI003AF3BEBC
MGMECPAVLTVPLGLIGMEWPKGDEDAMDRLHAGWHQYAFDINEALGDINAVSSTIDTSIRGDTQKAIHEQLKMLQSGDRSLHELAEQAEFLAERCDMMSTELTALKVIFIVELIALMIFIEIALATAYVNWGAPAEIAAEEAATQLTLRQVIEQMVERILEEFTVKAFLKNAGKNFAMEAAKTAIEESLKEGRDHWMWGTGYDVKKVAGESLKSGLAGAALTPLSTPVEKVTGTLFEGGLTPLLSRGLQNNPGLRFGADVLANQLKDKGNEQLLDKPTQTAKSQLESAWKWLTKPEPKNPHSAPSSPDATPASPTSVPSATPSPGTPPPPATQAGTAPTPATPDSTSTAVPSR